MEVQRYVICLMHLQQAVKLIKVARIVWFAKNASKANQRLRFTIHNFLRHRPGEMVSLSSRPNNRNSL